MLKRALHYVTLCLVGLIICGCTSVDTLDDYPVPQNNPVPFPGNTFPRLDLANSVIPLPNDLLRNPTTGRLAFPGTGEPFDAANSLDGFSTSGAIIIPFRGTVKPETVNNDTLPVFNSKTGQKALMNYTVTANEVGSVVTAVPVLALEPETQYIVVTTSGIISALSNSPILSDNTINFLKSSTPLADANGNSLNPALSDAQASALEPVRIAYLPIWARALQFTGQRKDQIPLAFAFTTQTLFEALPAVRSQIVAANNGLSNANPAAPGTGFPVALGHTPATMPGQIPSVEQFYANLPAPLNSIPPAQLANIGRIHLGFVPVPIFRADPAEGFWANPPVQVGTRNVPFLLFLPNSVAQLNPANPPKPVVIYQHGITLNKGTAAILANGICGQDLALIAIDLEHHGDLKTDPSKSDGEGFVNLPNLRNSRDNILGSVANLYGLTQAIVSGQSNIDGVGGPELAPGTDEGGVDPVLLAMSLGGIVGDVFHATEPNITASALNAAGARITALLLGSESFRPLIISGLAASGVQEGTPQFAQFFLIAQAVIDDADPVNYGDEAISGNLRGGKPAQILQQVYTTDGTIPPSAQYDMALQSAQGAASPVYSQVSALNAISVPQATAPYAGPGFFEIAGAGHGALLDPSAGPTTQIVTQALTFLGAALNPMGTGVGLITESGLRARQLPFESVDPTDYTPVVKF